MKTILLIFFLCSFIRSYTQPGTLDKSFGDTGVALNKTLEGLANVIGLWYSVVMMAFISVQ